MSSLPFLLQVLLLIVVLLCTVPNVHGSTQIKWTAASNQDKNDPAANAPRSQKYWDEHGIKRPDYAKTDAELAAERRNEHAGRGSSSNNNMSHHRGIVMIWTIVKWILLIVGVGTGIVGYQQYNNSKHRLGGVRLDGRGSSLFQPQPTAEEARNARLARFDDSMKAD